MTEYKPRLSSSNTHQLECSFTISRQDCQNSIHEHSLAQGVNSHFTKTWVLGVKQSAYSGLALGCFRGTQTPGTTMAQEGGS